MKASTRWPLIDRRSRILKLIHIIFCIQIRTLTNQLNLTCIFSDLLSLLIRRFEVSVMLRNSNELKLSAKTRDRLLNQLSIIPVLI